MNFEQVSIVILTWLSILSIIVGAIAWVFKRYIDRFKHEYDIQLHAAQSEINNLRLRYKLLRSSYTTLNSYAHKVYDEMVRYGLHPAPVPTPTQEWIDDEHTANHYDSNR